MAKTGSLWILELGVFLLLGVSVRSLSLGPRPWAGLKNTGLNLLHPIGLYLHKRTEREKERERASLQLLNFSLALLTLSSKPKSKAEIMWPTDPLEYNRKQGQGQLYYNCLRPPRLFENRVIERVKFFFFSWMNFFTLLSGTNLHIWQWDT